LSRSARALRKSGNQTSSEPRYAKYSPEECPSPSFNVAPNPPTWAAETLSGSLPVYTTTTDPSKLTVTVSDVPAGNSVALTVDADQEMMFDLLSIVQAIRDDLSAKLTAVLAAWGTATKEAIAQALTDLLANLDEGALDSLLDSFGLPTVVTDAIKATSKSAVARLLQDGIRVVMLSGDHERTARRVASEAGIPETIAGVLPEGKVEAIRDLQTQGRVVLMAGDGVNDAPALAQADLGAAMASGSDVTVAAADLTLMRNDLRAVPTAIELSRKTMRVIRQNLFWAFVYNVVSIPIAAGALYPWFGILLSPVLASAAMALSSVSVVSNSLRLRAVKLGAR